MSLALTINRVDATVDAKINSHTHLCIEYNGCNVKLDFYASKIILK